MNYRDGLPLCRIRAGLAAALCTGQTYPPFQSVATCELPGLIIRYFPKFLALYPNWVQEQFYSAQNARLDSALIDGVVLWARLGQIGLTIAMRIDNKRFVLSFSYLEIISVATISVFCFS